MQFDAHDLGAGFIKQAGIEVPDEIRAGDFPSREETHQYGDDDFGVVIFDGSDKMRKFACPTPEAAWLNAQFLKLSWDHMPKTAAVLAGSNLLTRMAEGNIFDDELRDKVASSLYTDYRMEGELTSPYGIRVVDITNCPMEKKAFWGAAGKGFQTLGRAAKHTWGAGSRAATKAGPEAGFFGRMGARASAMGQRGGQFGSAVAKDVQRSGAAVKAWTPAAGAAPTGWMASGRQALGAASQSTKNLAAAGAVAAGGTAAVGGGMYMMGRRPKPKAQAKYASGVRNALIAGGIGTATTATGTAAVLGHRSGKKEGRRIGEGAAGSKAYHEGKRDGYAKAMSSLQPKTAGILDSIEGELHDPRLYSNLRGMATLESADERVAAHKKLRKGETRTVREAMGAGFKREKHAWVGTAAKVVGGTAALGAAAYGGHRGGTGSGYRQGRQDQFQGMKAQATRTKLDPTAWKRMSRHAQSYTKGPERTQQMVARVRQEDPGGAAKPGNYVSGQGTTYKLAEEAPMQKTAALGDQYDISTPDGVKQAEVYFDRYWRNFHPRDRRDFAVNTVKQAAALGVDVESQQLTKYAGEAISTQVLAHLTYRGRQHGVDDLGRETLIKLASSIPNLTPDSLADSMVEFDEHYGISQQWDSKIPDPYAAVCTEKTAERYSWTDGVDKVTEEELLRAASSDLSSVAQALGVSGARDFQKNPLTVFKSLPDPVKRVVARVASARRSTLGTNDLA